MWRELSLYHECPESSGASERVDRGLDGSWRDAALTSKGYYCTCLTKILLHLLYNKDKQNMLHLTKISKICCTCCKRILLYLLNKDKQNMLHSYEIRAEQDILDQDSAISSWRAAYPVIWYKYNFKYKYNCTQWSSQALNSTLEPIAIKLE